MKLQSYMGKDSILRLMVFSASLFLIFLVFPLHQDSSFLQFTYDSYKVTNMSYETRIHNSSAPAFAVSFTIREIIVNTTEKGNTLQKLNSYDTVPKVVENSTKVHIQRSPQSSIVLIHTSKEVGYTDSIGKNNFRNQNQSESHALESTTSTSMPLSAIKSRHNVSKGEKTLVNTRDSLVKREEVPNKLQLRRLIKGKEGPHELESTGIACSSNSHLDLCVISQPIILEKQKKSFNIYAPSSKGPLTKRVVKPYPKKEDSNTMNWVAPVSIFQGNANRIKAPSCDVKHNVPAVIFSFGGFTDNNYHKFSEVIIPLFVTTRQFGSRVQLVVTDNNLGETWKFRKVLKHLSPYQVIDANAEGDTRAHCFPAAVVGLRYFDNLEVNSTDTPGGYTMASFREFLRESYNLKVPSILKLKRPKVLLISRQRTRSFINEDKIMRLMKKLGFRVQKVKPNQMSNLDKFAKIVNSCDMMVGVHGAGLTNEIFLPDGALVLQIVPLGLEWGSEHYYATPARKMGLNYLEYKIEPNESSLYDMYGPNDPVISDPESIWKKGYEVVRDLYLDRQQIKVDLIRFRTILREALNLLR